MFEPGSCGIDVLAQAPHANESSRNAKYVVTRASPLVARALLLVTRSY